MITIYDIGGRARSAELVDGIPKIFEPLEFRFFCSDFAFPVQIERSNGHKEWRLNGLLHREDGPAIESATGTKSWFINGQRHRLDGPAIEDSMGLKSWWLNGKEYSEKKWKKKVKKLL